MTKLAKPNKTSSNSANIQTNHLRFNYAKCKSGQKLLFFFNFRQMKQAISNLT